MWGLSVLHLTAHCRPEFVQRLVEHHEANLAARDRDGRIPLMVANPGASLEMLEVILSLIKERGLTVNTADRPDFNARNDVGRPPLYMVGYVFGEGYRRGGLGYGDFEINRILGMEKYPNRSCLEKANDASDTDDEPHENLPVEHIISRGADATTRDDQGNLPFFLTLLIRVVTDTFLMVRAAASQDLFETSRVGQRRKLRRLKNFKQGKKPRSRKTT
eukprot:scaffold1598_cov192-Amphora_coffeaeformis.AAC.2